MNDVKIDTSGTVVTDPVVRRSKAGDPFITFRLAVTAQKWNKDDGWSDGDTLFFSVTAFRVLAGNAYHSLAKGQSVLVSGRLRLSTYTGRDGTIRTSMQIDAHDLGPSLKFGQTQFEHCVEPHIPSNDRLDDEIVDATRRALEEAAEAAEEHDDLPLAS